MWVLKCVPCQHQPFPVVLRPADTDAFSLWHAEFRRRGTLPLESGSIDDLGSRIFLLDAYALSKHPDTFISDADRNAFHHFMVWVEGIRCPIDSEAARQAGTENLFPV